MSGPVRRSLALALVGLAAGLALVAALVWGWSLAERETGLPGTPPAADAGTTIIPGTEGPRGAVDPGGPKAEGSQAEPGSGVADADPKTNPEAAKAPSFDIVRVEPNGDAVVAGRGAPNTVVEMLVDGRSVARALTDPDGQFAIVPPALPAGSSEIQLRSKTADGRETRSKQSVAVAVSEGRDRRPLVALTAPDAPTVVLSQPGAPEPPAGAADARAGATVPAAAAKAAPARIVSVDAQEGRLFVTGAGAPGASLKLYLNDTLIAPGRVGPDGKVTFTIGRGVKPGRYLVRIDQIEPGTGKVRGRAEVAFAVPEPAAVAGGREPATGGGPVAAADPRNARGGPAAEAPAPAVPPGATGPRTAERASPGSPATPSAQTDATRTGAVFVPEIATAKISRGDNLWRISTRTYGRGERYTVIYDANQAQIRDPDLIFPGQILVLPPDKGG